MLSSKKPNVFYEPTLVLSIIFRKSAVTSDRTWNPVLYVYVTLDSPKTY